jgi:hypothetical protein
MRFYVDNVDKFFVWMEAQGFRYAILRGYEPHLRGNLKVAGKADFDLLAEDRAIAAIREKYKRTTKWTGIKSDVYSVGTGLGADFLGHPIFPPRLANAVLENRVRSEDRFWIPGDEEYFLSLIYHLVYHKAEKSGFAFDDPAPAAKTKYFSTLQTLAGRLGIQPEWTLTGLHRILVDKGYPLDRERLINFLINDFARDRKSYFYAILADAEPGELNLFVIREVAYKAGLHGHLIEELAKKYNIITVKNVPWQFRLFKSGSMRGGKWKRGGKPYVAVVVFDPHPIPSDEENRAIHPFVFNSNQFIKRDLREWFVSKASVRDKDNALHSTDNEAEAIGHLPLFFSREEQQAIFTELARLRSDLQSGTPLPAAGQQS